MRQPPLTIVTIHDACPAFSKKIFTFTDKLESLRIHYNIALVPFFNENQDLPRFPNFINANQKLQRRDSLTWTIS